MGFRPRAKDLVHVTRYWNKLQLLRIVIAAKPDTVIALMQIRPVGRRYDAWCRQRSRCLVRKDTRHRAYGRTRKEVRPVASILLSPELLCDVLKTCFAAYRWTQRSLQTNPLIDRHPSLLLLSLLDGVISLTVIARLFLGLSLRVARRLRLNSCAAGSLLPPFDNGLQLFHIVRSKRDGRGV